MMEVKTNLHPRNYSIKEVYRIVNQEQAKRFMKHGCYPIDMYPSFDKEGRSIIVFVFLKEESEELKKLWDNYKLD